MEEKACLHSNTREIRKILYSHTFLLAVIQPPQNQQVPRRRFATKNVRKIKMDRLTFFAFSLVEDNTNDGSWNAGGVAEKFSTCGGTCPGVHLVCSESKFNDIKLDIAGVDETTPLSAVGLGYISGVTYIPVSLGTAVGGALMSVTRATLRLSLKKPGTCEALKRSLESTRLSSWQRLSNADQRKGLYFKANLYAQLASLTKCNLLVYNRTIKKRERERKERGKRVKRERERERAHACSGLLATKKLFQCLPQI